MKRGDRVRARTDMKIRQAAGTLIDIGVRGGAKLAMVEWDEDIEGKNPYEIPLSWLEVIPAIDRLADLT